MFNSRQENIKEVLTYIINILTELKIPFHLTGGVAAIAYGAKRPLYDIDIDIPENQFEKLYLRVKEFVTFGPGNFKDQKWDLTMMTIKYRDVSIDISGAYTGKIFDEKSNKWLKYNSDLKNTETHEVFGLSLPVISKEVLISYKTILGRPTDLEDIDAMKNNG